MSRIIVTKAGTDFNLFQKKVERFSKGYNFKCYNNSDCFEAVIETSPTIRIKQNPNSLNALFITGYGRNKHTYTAKF